MKKATLFLLLTLLFTSSYAQFNKYFEPKTLRLDYFHCGSSTSEDMFFKELIEEPHWAGNQSNLIDDKEYGNQMLKVYDVATGALIYSQGYCTLFTEWQTTPEALNIKKCYPEAVIMPFPKVPVRIEISSRERKNNDWVKVFEYTHDPSNYWIRKTTPSDETFDVMYNGAAAKKVDIVLLSEGYTDRDKFENDCRRFAEEMFKFEPFKTRKEDFNIRGVWRASKHSGASMPGEHIWKESALNSQYYTFDSERYIMVDDLQVVRDMAASVPYDLIYILADTKKYGGGGVYNFYGISAAGDPKFAGKVYIHEFGHLLLGLGDEYVGTTNTDELYSKTAEPWEANLTTLVDFDKKDWKKMLPPGTKIPTEETEQNRNVLGVYEGGGYQSKGIYRPWQNCLMRVLSVDDFCPVCTKAINQMIDKYVK